MSATLYAAVALCIGSPADQVKWGDMVSSINGIRAGACDVGGYFDGGPQATHWWESSGYSASECLAALDAIHDHGNVVKFCAPIDASLLGFRVDWAKSEGGAK